MQVAEQQAAAASKVAKELLAAEEKAWDQPAGKTTSQNKAKAKAAAVKQSCEQASSREDTDAAKAEAKKAKKQRQKAKKQAAQTAPAQEQLTAESSSAQQRSAQAVVPQHQQQSVDRPMQSTHGSYQEQLTDGSQQQQPTDAPSQPPSQQLQAGNAGSADHAADIDQRHLSLHASCTDAQPGAAGGSSAHSIQTRAAAHVEAAAASSAHRDEAEAEGAKVDACAASKAPAAESATTAGSVTAAGSAIAAGSATAARSATAAGSTTAARSATAARSVKAAGADAAAHVEDAPKAKTRGEGQRDMGVSAKIAAAAHALDAADTGVHSGQQAASMPEHAAASSEATQQQHAPRRDQHQQAMAPATEALLASIPQLDRSPHRACAAGVSRDGEPNNGLPSTSSEQEHTHWAAAQPGEWEHTPQAAAHASGQAKTKLAQRSRQSQAAMAPAVGPTLSHGTEQLPLVKGQSQGLLQGLVEEEHQHIRAAPSASTGLSSAAAPGQTSPGMAVGGKAAAEAASILTPYRAPAEHCALWFHCPLTKVGHQHAISADM